ncbi:MAG: serine hydrolase [Gemmatimonadota bacterium]
MGHLLSMQSGLERTSGRNYGGWVSSSNWVRDALRRPMVADPGGRMLYSTGNYHLLSAILTRVTGESTHAYARSRLGDPSGIAIPGWMADPQGIYFGGNEMRLTPRGMLRFGELYRNRGRLEGREVVPSDWVRRSLVPRTRSPWSGEEYGYGWFLGEAGSHPMFYAWGYGGQFIFVVPDLAVTMVTTSNPAVPRGGSHLRDIHAILDRWIVPAAENGAGTTGERRPDPALPSVPVSGSAD